MQEQMKWRRERVLTPEFVAFWSATAAGAGCVALAAWVVRAL